MFGLFDDIELKMLFNEGGFYFNISIIIPMNGYLSACLWAAFYNTSGGKNWSKNKELSNVNPKA